MTPPLFVPALGRSLYPGASVALDFTRNLYRSGTPVVKGSPSLLSGWTFTRASTGYAETAAGAPVAFASGAPRITDKGLLVEEARTNVVLWNRDQTNAAWVKSNMTAAQDQTGPDGVANSASSLAATAGNATSLQAITLASSARFQTARVKRITGSGAVEMTMDNGATWTAISPTSAWTRVSIPTQTLANPTVGFRIVTSGDAIAVDFVQNENGTFSTSDIPTTTASATRAADVATISGLTVASLHTLYAEVTHLGATAATDRYACLSNGVSERTTIGRSSGGLALGLTTAGGVTPSSSAIAGAITSGTYKLGISVGSTTFVAARSGTLGTVRTNSPPASLSLLTIGAEPGFFWLNGYVRTTVLYPTALTDAALQALTT